MKHLVEVEGSKMKDLMSNSNHSEIQRWMAEQYSVRQQHFSKHRHLLREKETKPYKTSSQVDFMYFVLCVYIFFVIKIIYI